MDFIDQPPNSSILIGNQSTFCGFPDTFALSNGNSNKKYRSESRETIKQKEDLDKYLLQSMEKLSVQDRERALEEVHGIATRADTVDEVSLEVYLQEMDKHLNSIKHGSAYERAESMDGPYVSNRDLRYIFLHANKYDPKAGADQMLRYFEEKQFLFGKGKLTTDITLYDLDDDDKKCLEAGFFQILHEKDVAGRTVILFMPWLRPVDLAVENEMRAAFYMFGSFLQQGVEALKRGAIVVVYSVGRHSDSKGEAASTKFGALFTSTPILWASIHICFDDYQEYLIGRAFIFLLPMKLAAKIRSHFGSHMECRYTLCAFGIGEGSVPISPLDAAPLLHNHRIWYKERQQIDADHVRREGLSLIFEDLSMGTKEDCFLESESDTTSPIPINYRSMSETTTELPPSPNGYALLNSKLESTNDAAGANIIPFSIQPMERAPSHAVKLEPRTSDILFGQEQKVHPGNLQLRKYLTQHLDDYEATLGKKQKVEFAQKVVKELQASGSRFLIFDRKTETWKEVSDKVARNKVSKTIRNSRRTGGGK